jgi:hypothetical protein
MTTAARLMTDLQAHGVTLAADGDRLRFYPRDRVTGELLARLRTCKAGLLAMLQPQDIDAAELETVTSCDAGPVALQSRPVAVPRTWPAPVPKEIIADPIPTCSDCGQVPVVPGQPGRPLGLCYSCWSKRP